jgi:hypothetical protein
MWLFSQKKRSVRLQMGRNSELPRGKTHNAGPRTALRKFLAGMQRIEGRALDQAGDRLGAAPLRTVGGRMPASAGAWWQIARTAETCVERH